MPLSMSREQQETHILFMPTSNTLSVTTSYPPHVRYFLSKYKPSVVSVDEKGNKISWMFNNIPAEHFRLPKEPKQISEKQAAAARERMITMHQRRLELDTEDSAEQEED